jgi:hypothetical protein
MLKTKLPGNFLKNRIEKISTRLNGSEECKVTDTKLSKSVMITS